MAAIALEDYEKMTKQKDGVPAPSLSRRDAPPWGDEFKAAWMQAKRYFEPGVITYEAVAERVSQLVPVSHTSVLRLGYLTEMPDKASTRQMAYLTLMAMGYDPLEFGLEPRDRALRGMTDAEIRKMLDPGLARKNGKH